MSASSTASPTTSDAAVPWRATVAGACASLVGIGLARFGYSPLLPAIVADGWFPPATANYLGAANLAGYVIGALVGAPLAQRYGAAAVLRFMMLLTGISMVACAWPVDFAWFFGWRLLSGITGGAVMVLAAPTVLAHVPLAKRGVVTGAIFMGVGLGVAASGTVVPLLLQSGLTWTWLGLAALALLLTAIAWNGWPGPAQPAPDAAASAVPGTAADASASTPPGAAAFGVSSSDQARRLRWFYLEYALNAVGLVPHMIFLVVFVARHLGQGVSAGAVYWIVFGLGAAIGPVLIGHAVDRLGPLRAYRLGFAIQAVAVLVPAATTHAIALTMSALVMGAFTPGIVPLALGRIREMIPHSPLLQRLAWSKATTAFAILQAAGAYGMSYLLVATRDDYDWLFGLGASALLLALVIDFMVARTSPR